MTAREKKREPKSERGGGGREGSFLPHPLPALLLAPLFSRSLNLVPRSFLLNRTETLATQAIVAPIHFLQKNQANSYVIMSVILMTTLFYKVLILQREIRH